MIKQIKSFFDQNLAQIGTNATDASDEHRLHLATAALLIEMMKVDDELDEREHATILQGLQSKFGLGSAETQEILRLAEIEAAEATDYFQFTSMINKHFTADQRAKLVEYLWTIAFADGVADAHEEHLVRRIADLIYVPHSEFIAAKQRAQKLT
ncbi:MAG: TerB family tellurite resistance protein [Gammaproteobacteria bacterium]|nr:TerB family tellurite resistance protein [Gammaproteobacteria bacterium]